jgi:serine/threonine protein kinase
MREDMAAAFLSAGHIYKRVQPSEESILEVISKSDCPYLLRPIRVMRDFAVYPRWSGADVWTNVMRVGIPLGFREFTVLRHSIMEALRALHSLGFCHCDIKPPNILCNVDRSAFCLSDFGSAVPHGGRMHEMSPSFAGPVAMTSRIACATDDYFAAALTLVAVCTMKKPAWTRSAAKTARGGHIRFECPSRGSATFHWPPPLWTTQQAARATALLKRTYHGTKVV